MQTVAVNSFVTRQIKGSGKSYAVKLSYEEMAAHAQQKVNQKDFHQGYREGVVLIDVSESLINHFYTPLVRINEDTSLKAEVTQRRENEEPYIQIRASGESPMKAGAAFLILYSHDVLAETDEHETNADWEFIAFNCLPEGMEDMPMGPVTMMRNQLELPGGTKAHYSSKEWAESVNFWQKYAMCDNSENNK